MNSLDAGPTDPENQRGVLQVSRNGVHSLGDDFDLEGFDGRPALRQNVDDINRRAGGQRGQQSIDWTRSGTTVAIEAGRGASWSARIENVVSHPLRDDPLRLAHFGPPFSMGARTAFPHSVQLPS